MPSSAVRPMQIKGDISWPINIRCALQFGRCRLRLHRGVLSMGPSPFIRAHIVWTKYWTASDHHHNHPSSLVVAIDATFLYPHNQRSKS